MARASSYRPSGPHSGETRCDLAPGDLVGCSISHPCTAFDRWRVIPVVDDQFGAPTTSIELARATRAIVDGVLAGQFGSTEDWAGLYHMTCSGSTTWCGFTRAIFARAGHLLNGRHPEVVPIPSSEYPTPAKRPGNSVLSNARAQGRFAVQLAPWEVALDAVIDVLRAEAREKLLSAARS